jgi:hypothetical protein
VQEPTVPRELSEYPDDEITFSRLDALSEGLDSVVQGDFDANLRNHWARVVFAFDEVHGRPGHFVARRQYSPMDMSSEHAGAAELWQ